MKELKMGEFVWSKTDGCGLVYEIGTNNAYGVLFEGNISILWIYRESLFAKGDEVTIGEYPIPIETCTCIFRGITDGDNMNPLVINIAGRNTYVSDIKHIPINTIKVRVEFNGKECDPSFLSEETWINLRRKSE